MRLQAAEFKVLQQMRSTRPFNSGHGTIHLLLSGGKDSIASFQLLNALQMMPATWSGVQFNLIVHHFNHKRRAAESDADEQLCVDVARQLGCAIELYRWPQELQEKLENGENFQSLARKWRYKTTEKFAVNHCQQFNETWWAIATAHHRRDHAESVLHNITRGCGLNGLQGIACWSDATHRFRPCLWLESAEFDAYVESKMLPHREDGSNQNLDYTRNRLRHVVLKELETLNPQIIEHLWNLSHDLDGINFRQNFAQKLIKELNPNESCAARDLQPSVLRIEIEMIQDISDLHAFIAGSSAPRTVELSRAKLSNLMSHVDKCLKNPKQAHEYNFALSEIHSLLITSKWLEIKVTS